MWKRASGFLAVAALISLQALFPTAAPALPGEDAEDPRRQQGESRWVPSLALIAGATLQEHKGAAASSFLEGGDPPAEGLRLPVSGDDLAIAPFVGASLQLIAPALPIRTRPRFFVTGEILPTFAADRDIAIEGNPDCVKGPEPTAPCARDEDGSRDTAWGEDAANGEGSRTTTTIDPLVFGATAGLSFPVQAAGRQLRIKPWIGWINYKVDAEGFVVDAACDPPSRCTDVTVTTPFGSFVEPGYLREVSLKARDSQRFNGIGPGLDVEMDAGRFGRLGAALFLGGGAYYVLGDRRFSFGTSESYPESPNGVIPAGAAAAAFAVEVDPWMYRAHLGVRFQWLGSQK